MFTERGKTLTAKEHHRHTVASTVCRVTEVYPQLGILYSWNFVDEKCGKILGETLSFELLAVLFRTLESFWTF